jgi:hypothetical protein
MAPDGLRDLGGVVEDEHGEPFALTEVCEIELIAERAEYANHYRFWALDRAGTTVKNIGYAYQKNIGYAYHESTAAEVIDELSAALAGCREWTEVDGTARMIVPNVSMPRPEGLSQFLAFCQDSPDATKRYACVAYLGQGNLVSRLSTARLDNGMGALDELRTLLPRATQALLAAQGT